jgi:hypothetical protein
VTFHAPEDRPDLYDNVVVSGQTWRGLVEVEGAERATEIQINKGKGSSGATVSVQGEGLAEPKLHFKLWKGYDYSSGSPARCDYFAEWDVFRKIFQKSKDPKNPIALTIEHPYFELAGIKSCVVKKVGQPKRQSSGIAIVTVELVEYRAPEKQKTGVTPASKAPAEAEKPKTEIQRREETKQRELDDLMKIAESL